MSILTGLPGNPGNAGVSGGVTKDLNTGIGSQRELPGGVVQGDGDLLFRLA